jgi:hypothetical protein
MDSNTPIKRPPRRRYMDAKSCYVLVLTGPIPSYQQQQRPQEKRPTSERPSPTGRSMFSEKKKTVRSRVQQDHNKDRPGPYINSHS